MPRVLSVAWSPDSQRLVSGDLAGGVLIWDASTGQSHFVYNSSDKPASERLGGVWSVAWSPDGKRIALAGDRGLTQVWQPE